MRKVARFLRKHAHPFVDEGGWVDMDIVAHHTRGLHMSTDRLKDMLKRYPNPAHFEVDGERMRCLCGHSHRMDDVIIDGQLGKVLTDEDLKLYSYPYAYFGAHLSELKDICITGLRSATRLHIHLTGDRRILRHKYEIAIQVDIPKAMKEGAVFIAAGNNEMVVLTRGFHGKLAPRFLNQVVETRGWKELTGTLDDLMSVSPLRVLPTGGDDKLSIADEANTRAQFYNDDDWVSVQSGISWGTTDTELSSEESEGHVNFEDESINRICTRCPHCLKKFSRTIKKSSFKIRFHDGSHAIASYRD